MRTNFNVGQTEDDALIYTRSIEIGTDHHRRTELIQTEIFVESREIALRENGQFDGEIRRTRLKTGVHRCRRDLGMLSVGLPNTENTISVSTETTVTPSVCPPRPPIHRQ